MRYTFDQFVLDTSRYEISENGNVIHAEPQVIELLTFLVRNRGRLVTRDELIQTVWKGRVISDSAVSGRIKIARKILGDDGRQQKYIRTIHKKGFSFIADAQAQDTVAVEPESSVRPDSDIERHRRGSRPSLGVLKFTDLSEDSEKGYFTDGMTEDLLTTLSKISKLIVVAYPEAPRNGKRGVDARRIGLEMNVGFVLFGSVRSDGDRLRISVHLVETGNGQYLWSQRYDRLNREIFDLQDEVTKSVVSALQVKLTEGDQALLLSHGTENIEAWQLTFQGQAAVLDHHQDTVRRGLQQLERAVELDKNYALAWSALAVAHWKESLNEGWSESREGSLKLAVEASDRALALEPRNAGILAMRSLVLVSFRKFDQALKLAKQALHHANSEANTIALAGIALRACCKPELSVMYTRKAMELCPIYPAWYPYGISVCHWMLGELDLAIEFARKAVGIDPDFSLSYFVLAMACAESGQNREAQDAVKSLLTIDPKFSSRAYTEGMPFSDPAVDARRTRALKMSGMPE